MKYAVQGVGVLLFILALPFIWLYEQVGGGVFLAIVLGVPLSIWWYWSRRNRGTASLPATSATPAAPARPHKSEIELKARKKAAAEAFQAENRRIIRKREEAAQRHPVHTVEQVTDEGVEVHIHWHRQLQEIKEAWQSGDYDYARTWLQKLAYRLTSEHAPEEVHAQFKTLMVAFTRDDPLYADVMRVALPAIAASPGIVQSVLAKQFPQFDAEQFRYAMYYGAEIGDVVREKKGRSYALRLPEEASNTKQTRKVGMKTETQQLLMAYIAATLNKMPDDWGAPRSLSGMEVVAALWPLNDVFRPHLADVGALPYEPRHEAEADAAVEAYAIHGVEAWADLPAGVWRVLMERHLQALVVVAAKAAAGNTDFMTIPVALPEAALPGAAMIYMLHGMSLQFPVKPRLVSEFPPVGAPVTRLLH